MRQANGETTERSETQPRTRTAELYETYLAAKAAKEVWTQAASDAADRLQTMLPDVPEDLRQPNPALNSGFWVYASDPPRWPKKWMRQYEWRAYSAEALRKLLETEQLPASVRAEAERLLPVAEASEAEENAADEASGHASFNDESMDAAFDPHDDAVMAVINEPPTTERDFMLKFLLIKTMIESELFEPEELASTVIEQYIAFHNETVAHN
jgi:hypothetical protein